MDLKILIISYLIIINIAGFVAFALDKQKAVKHQWRIRESVLFLLAILGGSVGCLLGMKLFRHKTKHHSFAIGIPTIVIIQITVICCLYALTGCGKKEVPEPVKAVEQELNVLKNSSADSVNEYITLADLFPSTQKSENTDDDVLKVFSLFFKNFDYQVIDYTIQEDTAIVDVKLTTIDAKPLAKDFLSQSIIKQIQGLAAPKAVTYSTKDYYHSLQKLLAKNEYSTTTTDCTIHLSRVGETWQLDTGQNLDSLLSGGFASYVSDPELFTPEEVASIYLDTIKSFDKEQMNQFLSLDSLFSADDEYKRAISKALAEQILKYLDYEIMQSTSDGVTAKVKTNITSCDCLKIIQNYSDQVGEYIVTSQALQDGISGRLTKANQILVDCLNNNTQSATTTITLTLVNAGANWELKMDEELAQAILGNIQAAVSSVSTNPVSAEVVD